MRQYPLARPSGQRARSAEGWPLEEFAARARLHPQLVRRFVALGLLVPQTDTSGGMWFSAAQLARVGRIQRLRAGLGLNYAAVGVVLDLLARIEELEAALRTRPTFRSDGPWT